MDRTEQDRAAPTIADHLVNLARAAYEQGYRHGTERVVRTCDGCAVGSLPCRVSGDAYLCDTCWDELREERPVVEIRPDLALMDSDDRWA